MSMQTEISRKWASINGWLDLCEKINKRCGFTIINSRRTTTERIAKRIRRGQPYQSTEYHSPWRILSWAEQYAMVRRFGALPRMQPCVYAAATAKSGGKLFYYEADYAALSRLPVDQRNEYVLRHYSDPVIVSHILEWSAITEKNNRVMERSQHAS